MLMFTQKMALNTEPVNSTEAWNEMLQYLPD
jgi:hypothetical protein